MSEEWPDPEAIRETVRQGWIERFHDDCIEVLEHGLNRPIHHVVETTHEWVNKAMFDDLVDSKRKIEDQLELLKKCGAAVSAANAARRQMQEQLASPPPPWKTFGQTSTQYDVVFWGDAPLAGNPPMFFFADPDGNSFLLVTGPG